MAWFLRAVELQGGSWACRLGNHEYDTHESLDQALSHLRLISATLGATELFAHHLDGGVVPQGKGRPPETSTATANGGPTSP